MSKQIWVYLEIGKAKTFAVAIDWPGWARSGRDETSALQALLDYAPRYARAIQSGRLGFQPPAKLTDLVVTERLRGNSSTDFGAPGIPPSVDAKPVSPVELKRLRSILEACWLTFDTAVKSAQGKILTK